MSLQKILKRLSFKRVTSFLGALCVTVIAILLQERLNVEIEMALFLRERHSIHVTCRSFLRSERTAEGDYR